MCQFISQNISAFVAAISVIVSLITFIIATEISNKREFIKTFDRIYQLTFKLRVSISNDVNISKTIGDFHYELDTIMNNKSIEIKILNYLTEIENLSLILLRKKRYIKFSKFRFSYSKLFCRLSSPELYKRMMCLYPYITYKRIKSKNIALFSNYTELLQKIEKCETNNDFHNTVDKIFVGIRHSDIAYEGKYYHKDICIFPEKYEDGFCEYRANQNYKTNNFTKFYATQIKKTDKSYRTNSYKDYCLAFYNQCNSYGLPNNIKSHVICCNDEDILHILNDKAKTKDLLSNNSINVVPYCVLSGSGINRAVKIYKEDEKFVLQRSHGGGGIGTFLLDKKLLNKYINSIQQNGRYIISKYIENSISVNTHIIVSDNSNLVTPGSIQIIEQIDNQLMYRGADFISYRDLPIDLREQIRLLSIRIANLLREKGYKGIAGIDYLIDSTNNIYCSEINPRYQASSCILSKFLSDRLENTAKKSEKYFDDEPKSIHEINENAFNGIIKSSISYYDEINYSCYFYYNDTNLSKENIECWLDILKNNQNSNTQNKLVSSVDEDSFREFDEALFDNNSYLFKVIYSTKITQISYDHTLWINDNVRLKNIELDELSLKIALLNQGVRISKEIQEQNIKKAVFGGVDYKIIEKNICINSPTGFGLYQLSPFELKSTNNKNYLCFLKKPIFEIDIEKDYWNNQINDSSGELEYKDIIYISSDRLRVKTINGCDLKSCGMGCKFCEVPYSKCHYSIEKIIEAIKYSTKFSYNHILIGGGTNISDESWYIIIQITKFIKQIYPNKNISLMSLPIPDDKIIAVHNAGVDDVVYNIEIFDKTLAEYYMPGKRDNNIEYYYHSLKTAVNIFGCGNVRTSFIVGLESTSSLMKGINKICKIGVIPSLSVLRPLPNTIDFLNPPNNYLKEVYYQAQSTAQKYSLFVGPKCDACKNNMLSI